MSKFTDLINRSAMNDRLISIGTGTGNRRTIDLSPVGIPALTEANIQILAGEYCAEKKEQGLVWVEPFMVKSPQMIFTPSRYGLSRKTFQYVIWIKTHLDRGVYFNEAVSGMIEERFANNLHIPLPSGDVITILKTYQQATISVDDVSGRLYNRVFVDAEVYYESQK